MGKKPDISMDSPEKARERFEQAVDAAMKSGLQKPQPSNRARGNWARIKAVEKSRENTK